MVREQHHQMSDGGNSHFLVDELQSTVYCAFGLGCILFEEYRSDELVDVCVFC